MSLLLKAVFAFYAILNIEKGIDGLTTCLGTSFNESCEASQCRSILFEPVCFICNISRDTNLISWHIGNIKLANGDYNLDSSHAGGLVVNQCASRKYCIKLQRPNTNYDKALYVCKQGSRIISKFCLELRAYPILIINTNKTSNRTFILPTTSQSMEVLECVVMDAVSPLTIIWKLDDTEKRRTTFTNYSEEPSTFSYPLYLPRVNHVNFTVTCSVEGIFVPNLNTSLKIKVFDHNGTTEDLKINAESTTSHTSFKPIHFMLENTWILAGFSVICLTVCLACAMKCYRRRKHICNSSKSNLSRLSTDNGGTTDIVESDGALRDRHFARENCIGDVHFRMTDESKNHGETSLLTKVKVDGTYEYWQGNFSTGNHYREKCFVKTLSDQATLQEASVFKTISKHLTTLKESENVVRILSLNINNDRYAIVYEYLDCGSLRDFVRTQYHQRRLKVVTEFKIQAQQLLTFASNIASAMFTHPVLSLKKALLTSQCTCKLYDIFPKDMAMTKVHTILNKHHPPIAWMPPETIFLSTHSSSSDVWSFAVLLWELFSLGETPYAGRSTDEIERDIRASVNLPQPLNCPGAVYEVMLSSWDKNDKERPSFLAINQKLRNMLELLHKDGTFNENQYFTFDSSETKG